jgi:hypothetical protein
MLSSSSVGGSDAGFNGTFHDVHAPSDGVVLSRNTALDQVQASLTKKATGSPRPPGRDVEFWLQAESEIRVQRDD